MIVKLEAWSIGISKKLPKIVRKIVKMVYGALPTEMCKDYTAPLSNICIYQRLDGPLFLWSDGDFFEFFSNRKALIQVKKWKKVILKMIPDQTMIWSWIMIWSIFYLITPFSGNYLDSIKYVHKYMREFKIFPHDCLK